MLLQVQAAVGPEAHTFLLEKPPLQAHLFTALLVHRVPPKELLPAMSSQ